MPLWGGFINFVISLISYNVYNIIYYIYVCPCWRVGRLRLGGVGMLYPCAPHAPTGGRGWYGCNRVGRWPVGRFCARWRGFGRWVGMLYPRAPVWPSEGRKLPRLVCWVGRWSVGRVPVPPVGGLPLTGATGLAVGLFLFSHIQFVFVGGGGTIPNVGRWPVGLFQLPVGWVGLFLFLCWPSEVGGGWLAVWRVHVPCVGQTGAGLVCCTPVPCWPSVGVLFDVGEYFLNNLGGVCAKCIIVV